MTSKIDLSKSIPRDRWGEFFDQFINGASIIVSVTEGLAAQAGN
jgi:hypothetical protein